QSDWYQTAANKGSLLLHELRRRLGPKEFIDLMESFGQQNAGKEVTTAAFREHVERAAGKRPNGFVDYWLAQQGLTRLRPGPVRPLAWRILLHHVLPRRMGESAHRLWHA